MLLPVAMRMRFTYICVSAVHRKADLPFKRQAAVSRAAQPPPVRQVHYLLDLDDMAADLLIF